MSRGSWFPIPRRLLSDGPFAPSLILLFSLLLYGNTLANGFVFDDRLIIERNPVLQSAERIPRLLVTPYWSGKELSNRLYRPLTLTTFALNRLVLGSRPWGYHLVNALLHGAVSVLLWFLLLRLFSMPEMALFAALIFLAHPVQTEAVAGLVGRAEILSALFLLLALTLGRVGGDPPGGKRSLLLIASLVSFFLALLSKENALVYPVLLILTDFLVGRPRSVPPTRRAVEILATLAVAGGYLLLRHHVLGSLMEPGGIAEVDNQLAHRPPRERIFTALALIGKYLGLFFYPAHLSADYSTPQIPPVSQALDPRLWIGVATLAGLVALFLRSGRRLPPLSWGIGFAGASFFLVSNLAFPIGTIFAERLLYLPSMGLCTATGFLLSVGAEKRPRLTGFLMVTLLSVCAVRTVGRNLDWVDDLSLFRSAARVSERSAKVRFNLGNAYRRRGDLSRAEESYRACLERYPAFDPARQNLGVVLMEMGRSEEAVGVFREALSISPRSSALRNHLGTALSGMGRSGEAEAEYRKASELDPLSADPHNNLANLLQAKGEMNRAVVEYREAIRLAPDRMSLRVNLGNVLLQRGEFDSAEQVFREAVRRQPSSPEPHRGLGEALLGEGNWEEAETELRRSLSLRPKQWEAPALLGYLHQRRGEVRSAIGAYRESLSVNPDQPELHRNLGLLYAEIPGEKERALEHLRRSLALDPSQKGALELGEVIRKLERPTGPQSVR